MRFRVVIAGVLGLGVSGYLILAHRFWRSILRGCCDRPGLGLRCSAFIRWAYLRYWRARGRCWSRCNRREVGAHFSGLVWCAIQPPRRCPFRRSAVFCSAPGLGAVDGLKPAVAVASMIADISTELVAQTYSSASASRCSIPESELRRVCLQRAGWWLACRSQRSRPPVSMQYSFTAEEQSKGSPRKFVAAGQGTCRCVDVGASKHLSRARTNCGLPCAPSCGLDRECRRGVVALRLMGAPVGFLSVLGIESLVYAIRSVGFAVPNAFGIQETAYVFLAPYLGIGPEIGLAISLLKRARDIAIGIPTLLLWQSREGQRLLAAGQTES